MALQRKVKNVVNNYTPIECKVREATSNDPCGPSLELMDEISQSTFHVISVSEIMSIIYKRLNDTGKNWRHVYKSLQLLDYLLKNGHESVASQCLENISVIKKLTNFHYIEMHRDHGEFVRKKAGQIVVLLEDLTQLISERLKAEQIKKRRIINIAVHNKLDSAHNSPLHTRNVTSFNTELKDYAYPSSREEEDAQLKIALEVSMEDAKHKRSNPSEQSSPNLFDLPMNPQPEISSSNTNQEHLINFSSDVLPEAKNNSPDPFDLFNASWSNKTQNDDPWSVAPTTKGLSTMESKINPGIFDVDELRVKEQPTQSGYPGFYESKNNNLFDNFPTIPPTNHTTINNTPPIEPCKMIKAEENNQKKKEESKPDPVSAFLGEHSDLVNLDKLVEKTNRPSNTNPFTSTSIVSIKDIDKTRLPISKYSNFNQSNIGPSKSFSPLNPNGVNSHLHDVFPNQITWDNTGSSNSNWMQISPSQSMPNQKSMNTSLNPFL